MCVCVCSEAREAEPRAAGAGLPAVRPVQIGLYWCFTLLAVNAVLSDKSF